MEEHTEGPSRHPGLTVRVKELPRFLNGYTEVARWIGTLGVDVSALMLKKAAAAIDLQPHRRNGRAVFRPADLRRLVEHYTGYSYKEWFLRWDASDKKTPLVWRQVQRPRGAARPLTLIVMFEDVLGETQAARRTDGFVYAATERKDEKAWSMAARERAGRVVEYRRSRLLTPEDLEPVPDAKPETAVVLPTVMRNGRLEDVTCDGRLFGLEAGTRTRLLAPLAWPKWRSLKAGVDRALPGTAWVVWDRGVELGKFGGGEKAIPEWRGFTSEGLP